MRHGVQFEPFDIRVGDIESYLERLEMHFLTNDIAEIEVNATKRKAILLSSIGAEAYRILKEYLFPRGTDRKDLHCFVQ